MKLPELFQQSDVEFPNIPAFSRANRPYGMPPLKFDMLTLNPLVGDQRNGLRTPVTGDVSLLLKYKQRESSVLSLQELNNGDEWRVLQVQGARSRRGSYRVASSFEWQRYLGESVNVYANYVESEVRAITMPPLYMIGNIDAAVSERVGQTYQAVRNVLGMRWSEELGFFIVDVVK